MPQKRQSQAAATRVRDYAMPSDFCQIFHDDMTRLYALSFLLTADPGEAEQCFVAGLDDCVQHKPVFREWAQSWARRSLIKNAIRMIAPSWNKIITTSKEYELAELSSDARDRIDTITKLPTFLRFVYVMSVLEGYSDRECSLLLDSTVPEIVDARTQALQRLAAPALTASDWHGAFRSTA